jgi:protein disulfide-isomerase A1
MDSVQDIFGSKIGRVAFLFRSADDAASVDPIFKQVATTYRGTAVFVTADFAEQRLNQYIGVEAPGPHFIFAETPQGGALRRFPLDSALTLDSMSALVGSYKDGTLKPTLKSDPIPATNPGPVKVIVGKNFNEIVMDETKDVLLEVYAPWCGHCKKLEPTWNDLGKEFAGDSSIVVAKMDGTTNEVDGLSAQGFPTILFYPAGTKTTAGTPYSGARELKDFKEFLHHNRKSAATTPHTHDHDHHHDDSEL